MLNTLPVPPPQTRFQVFSKCHSSMLFWVSICLPMTGTWAADGANGLLYISWIDEQNCQEPGCTGWMPHGRQRCSEVTVTRNKFD